ncbi:hypothetical protein [Chitinophaga qingshengii]|uniref:Uncharacterized protein n=1 Tax=Chitinophaga qingshengii TaxID=1569794 RepID=A0ABR7TH56_9BACT|nr:hypothetical protein [Chitinophaga qingshengii]MBC9929268.1 hypothetical protein [Chitinophaga qingshengii]
MHRDNLSPKELLLVNRIEMLQRPTGGDSMKVLLLYDFPLHFIGDTICRFCYLKALCGFFEESVEIEVNCPNGMVHQLIRNNPYVSAVSQTPLMEIDYMQYHMIIITSIETELAFLNMLSIRYADTVLEGSPFPQVFSVTAYFDKLAKLDTIFSSLPGLGDYIQDNADAVQKELFLTAGEIEWGGNWLRGQGVKEDDNLIVMFDDSSRKIKQLNMEVYFDLLQYYIDNTNAKILIYDEKGIGKDTFYEAWLGSEQMARLVFARQLGLRNDISLLADKAVKLIFGPCTGMMHCAAAVYGVLVNNGFPRENVPLIITYTGKDIEDPTTKWDWWGGKQLSYCILVGDNDNGQREIFLLEQYRHDYLSCKNFTVALITGFLRANFTQQLQPLFNHSSHIIGNS